MMRNRLATFLVGLAIAAILLFSFGRDVMTPAATPLAIVSGSENRALEPLILDWAAQNNLAPTITYLGSVDISREIAKGTEAAYDAVWPANSLWLQLGDTQKVIKHPQSILRSPVVLGLRKPIAESLGWVGRDDVTIQMIEQAAAAGKFRLAMTSATQSNSGASAYFGFLYAMAGSPDVLTSDILADPALQDRVRSFLATVDRSSGSSGWLKDALVANPDAYDAMFNYESTILEANQALTAAGQEPLYIIYPANGLSVADSPLAYVSKGDAATEAAFLSLQAFLLSPETQQTLSGLGRRSGLIGMDAEGADPAVWRRDWGVDLTRAIAPIPTPEAGVIAEALRLYQTELRKPSLTIWVLDVSGSMEGQPIEEMKQAMRLLLDKKAAAVNLLQPSRRDVAIILPFNDTTLNPILAEGDSDAVLEYALTQVNALEAGGGTDLYLALDQALDLLQAYADDGTLRNYLPAIVAMTDGESGTDNRDAFLADVAVRSFGRDVPIHAIVFGNADEEQLQALTDGSIGRLFQSDDGLAEALRQAKGYN
jgi:Ca-activated chloride channel family protein